MPTLFIVATPIGNLEDMTMRAVRTLNEVDLILCEDTRITKRLLLRYDINKPTMSYHAQSKLSKVEKIIAMLGEGKNLALVSDAGTPTISDPGCLLVREVRKHFGDIISVLPIPGPSAVLAALSVSGFPSSEFLFLGFLPHKKGRETRFKEIALSERTIVFYESPHRIDKTLVALEKFLPTTRRILVSREITKIHEEHVLGTPKEVIQHYNAHPDRLRGEFVIAVEGA